jgi:heat shock protein HslJ
MKRYFPFVSILLLAACSTPSQTTQTTISSTSSSQALEPEDSVVVVKMPIEFEQKDLLPQLLGSWGVQSMQRQTKLPLENLSNISLNLQSGGAFTANTNCGPLSGSYSVKGMSIKFNDVRSSWNNCGNTEQLNEMVRLLQKTVSMYTVEGNSMTLRDNSSNVIFRANRM